MIETVMLSPRLRIRDCSAIKFWILEKLVQDEFGQPSKWWEIGAFTSSKLLRSIALAYYPDEVGRQALAALPRFYREHALDEIQDRPPANATGDGTGPAAICVGQPLASPAPNR